MMALGALGSACSDVVVDTKMLESSCGKSLSLRVTILLNVKCIATWWWGCSLWRAAGKACFQVELYFNILMALGAICTACSDVVVDIVVERSHGEPQVRPVMAFREFCRMRVCGQIQRKRSALLQGSGHESSTGTSKGNCALFFQG